MYAIVIVVNNKYKNYTSLFFSLVYLRQKCEILIIRTVMFATQAQAYTSCIESPGR